MRIAWSRAIVAAFWFATSAYCVLSAVPFASEQFLKPRLVPALATFAEWHAWISLAALVTTAVALMPWLRSRHRGACAFIVVWTLAAVASIGAPPLARLEPSPFALALALISLTPPIWISLLDLPSISQLDEAGGESNPDEISRDFAACMVAAVVVTAIHGAAALPSALPFGIWSAALTSLRSLLVHLVVFCSVFAIVCLIRGTSRLVSSRATVEAWLARGVLASALALFLFTTVLRPLSLAGAKGALVAVAFGLALAATIGPRATGAGAGLIQALAGLAPRWATHSGVTASVWMAIVAVVIWSVERRAAVTDWHFTIAKSAAFVSWLLALATAVRSLPARTRAPAWVPFACCFALLAAHVTASRGAVGTAAADAWTAHDPSARLIVDALTPVAPVSDEGLLDFLQVHTNIPRSTRVEPVSIDLAQLEGAPTAARPHIFVFVIDSLRRDYLSPYNRAVTFTPALDRFARESTVFQRAFTRYGATGLSVPSLWVGGLLLHKQYVTPFAPMNTLAKLLEHEQYEQWISMDNILDVILPPSPRRAALDVETPVVDLRLCRTLDEVRRRFDRLTVNAAPIFVYSLPQDIHVSVITREGTHAVDGESYGAFYAPYASRVRRMDTCFGAFIDDLKVRGLFEHSIIIITSDHGDSLGEQGRMGHAYTIFPEIVQVPLLVHLPSDLAVAHTTDTSAPAFTTDVTPTLYALLGHRPRPPGPFFGRPLFHKESTGPPRTTEPQLLASSYGSVYGTLLNDARRLYVIDGISLREYSYELDGTGAGRAIAVSDRDRALGQQAIRATVQEIATFYGYRP
jgi:glucan phosphoethanolaminetransferase (alkaline phosphatase superfamily)